PDGADHIPLLPRPFPIDDKAPLRIGFLGNYTWGPSLDAALVLLDEIWPQVRAARSDVELVLAGAGAPPSLVELASRCEMVKIVGIQDDVQPMLQSLSLFVCPLRIGGGIKVKILEALRSGCAIVSTPIGLQGLSERAVRAVHRVEHVDAMPDAILTLLDDGRR